LRESVPPEAVEVETGGRAPCGSHDDGGEMTLSHEHGRGAARAWIRRLIRGSRWNYSPALESVLVARSMGRHVPLDQTAAAVLRRGTPRATRSDLLAEWTRSRAITYGEAELLVALDETTPWRA
jgi:hypothetical protein